ncbi:hypothetical protein JTB14_000003 [Gonioctena quinquepunctata]|nr:hypothetical protein JTB14_000003 [Gonioctena quinquepunctata]
MGDVIDQMTVLLEYSKQYNGRTKIPIARIISFGKFINRFSLIFVTAGTLFSYPWCESNKGFLFLQVMIENSPGNSLLLNIICYFMLWINSIIVVSMICTFIYASVHLKIQFLILNDELGKFNRDHSKFENFHIHNFLDQKTIKKKLTNFLNHYLTLKRFRNIVNEIMYLPAIIIMLHVILILGCVAINILSERFHVLLQLCHWYRWNRENKHFLLVFLAATKEPLTFSSSGLIYQNRMMILRVGI